MTKRIPVYKTVNNIKFALYENKIYFFDRTMELEDNIYTLRFSLKDIRQILDKISDYQNGKRNLRKPRV